MLQLSPQAERDDIPRARLQYGSYYHPGIQDSGELGLECPNRGFPSELCPVIEALWQALGTLHTPRMRGLAESLPSWLKPNLRRIVICLTG